MKFLEKNLEQIIFESDKDNLQDKGLYIGGKLFRQLKIGNYGISDLVEYSRPYYNEVLNKMYKGKITVYELKQEKIGVSTFLQALGYLKGIRKFLENRGTDDYYDYEIVLIGSELELNNNFCYLTDFMYVVGDSEFYDDPSLGLSIFTYDYKIDGIEFKRSLGYYLKNNTF